MRASITLLVAGLGLAMVSAAQAQSSGRIPIERDLRRWDRVETNLGNRDPDTTSSIGRVQSDPTGVAGYTGAPGGYGDSVNGFGALPQGAAGADIR